ncbi:MAG: DegV family protein [Oscillospiraceae bacterium]|nr:DegV family protein [Oscillospiraceae bacterium]
MYIKITADSACDLGQALVDQYEIGIFPLQVTVGQKTGRDGLDIMPGDIYKSVEAGGALPVTAAVNPAEFTEKFGEYSKTHEAVIYISIGSLFSSCYQNACIAAAEYPNVYVVDSRNLSTGYGHMVIEAALLARTSATPQEIVAKLIGLAPRVRAGFVLGRLDYMKKGGRCSAVAALGANLLKLKPCIAVENGKMGMVKKYRGTLEKALREYVADQLKDRKDLVLNRIFITHSGVTPELLALVRAEIAKYATFQEVLVTQAGCTISSHCGPDCLGILYITK